VAKTSQLYFLMLRHSFSACVAASALPFENSAAHPKVGPPFALPNANTPSAMLERIPRIPNAKTMQAGFKRNSIAKVRVINPSRRIILKK
jgi:hypothetical protein